MFEDFDVIMGIMEQHEYVETIIIYIYMCVCVFIYYAYPTAQLFTQGSPT